MQRFVLSLSFLAVAFAIPVEEATRRLVTVSCTVSQRSYAAPWEVWTSAVVEQPGLLSEPFVLTFASELVGDADCSVLPPGGGAQPAEVARYDRRLDLVVLRVRDEAFWKAAPGPVQRAGVLPLGSRATAVTGPVFRAVDAQLTVFGPRGGPAGGRLVAGLAPAPAWPGFLFDSYGRFAGLVADGTVTPEWSFGTAWDKVVPAPMLGLGVLPSENPAFRARYGVPDGRGVLVRGASPAWRGVGQPGDTLVAVAGNDVGHDGTVHVDSLGVRLPVSVVPYAIPGGFNATIRAGKDGKEREGPVMYMLDEPEAPPSYLAVGGLVFVPPTNALIEELSGDWLLRVPDSVPSSGVVLANRLPHAVNAFLPTDTVRGLHSCNGEGIDSLRGLLKLVKSTEGFVACSFVREDDSDRAVGVRGNETPAFPDFVWDTKELKAVGDEILDQYHLTASMSMDLCGDGAMDARTEKARDAHAKRSLVHQKQRPHRHHGMLRGARQPAPVASGGGWPRDSAGRVAWGGHEHRDMRRNVREELPAELDVFGPGDESALEEAMLEPEDDSEGPPVLSAEPETLWPDDAGRSRALPPDRDGGLAVPLNHVVKILTTAAKQSFLVPWRFGATSSMTGSGVLVRGEDFGVDGEQLVLTNAHVVNGHQDVLVQRQDLARKLRAKVLVVAPDVDMAVLRVEDEELWRDVGQLQSSQKVPAANSLVRVAGYPLGGNAVSVTTGVVSRVIGMGYEFNQPHGHPVNKPGAVVAVQVDAAINPGNSGGPVFDSEGAFVGLAFAGMRGADNMGFVIPAEVVKARLPSLLDPSYSGIADFGVAWRKLENPTLRRYLELPEGAGVLVQSAAPLGPLAKKLHPGDVLLAVDGHKVAGDGTVLVPGESRAADLRLPLDALISGKPDGAETQLLVLRAKRAEEAESKEAKKAESKEAKEAESEDAKKAEAKAAKKAKKAESKEAEAAKKGKKHEAEKEEAKEATKAHTKAASRVSAATGLRHVARRHAAERRAATATGLSHVARRHGGGGTEELSWRHGGAGSEELSVVFASVPPRVPRYDAAPAYVVIGGLVFSKFTVPLLNAFRSNVDSVPSSTEHTLDTWKRHRDDDVVVLLDALRGPVNEFYSFPRLSILQFLNGEPVKSLHQLVELLPAAFKAEFLEFSFEASGFSSIVVNSTLAADDTELLSSYAVPAPASSDLIEAWCKSNSKAHFSAWGGCES